MQVIICLCAPVVFGQADPASNSVTSANDLWLTDLPTTDAARQVWRDRTRAAKTTSKDEESKRRLQNTLKKLKSLRFSDLGTSEGPGTVSDTNRPSTPPPPQSRNNQPVIRVRAAEPRERPAAPNSVPTSNSMLTPKTTEALDRLAKSPEKLLNPEAMAQILFQSKTYPEAALYYEEALKRLNKKTVAPSEDKAWLLFQIGNCLQQSDPDKTMKTYKQLISEYPNSLWSELVRVKAQCITWEIRDKPKALISEIKTLADIKRENAPRIQ